jgi:hypothetical protein
MLTHTSPDTQTLNTIIYECIQRDLRTYSQEECVKRLEAYAAMRQSMRNGVQGELPLFNSVYAGSRN